MNTLPLRKNPLDDTKIKANIKKELAQANYYNARALGIIGAGIVFLYNAKDLIAFVTKYIAS